MRLVRQKHPEGCAVAAFAMLMGMSFDRAATMLKFDGEGLRHGVLKAQLEYHGRFTRAVYSREQTAGLWPPRPFAPQHFAEVIQNESGNGHIVVVDDIGLVLDPLRPGRHRLDEWKVVNEVVGVL